MVRRPYSIQTGMTMDNYRSTLKHKWSRTHGKNKLAAMRSQEPNMKTSKSKWSGNSYSVQDNRECQFTLGWNAIRIEKNELE